MKTRSLALSAIFAAITVVFAQISIPLPFTPIPLSLSVAGSYLAGSILPARYAVYSQLIYILLGIIGLPVFGGFSGGIGHIAGPTGGYIAAYPLMALLVSLVSSRFQKKTPVAFGLGMLAALAVCYLFGSVWYSVVGNITLAQAFLGAVIPFIPMDLVKIVLLSVFAAALHKALKKAGFPPVAVIS